MQAFVSYRHTGESEEVLSELLAGIRDALKNADVEVYCTFFDEAEFQNKKMGPRQIMDHAFELISARDLLFVVQISDNKSEGMLMEIGLAIAKKIPVVVATHDLVGYTYVPDMADFSFRFADINDLKAKISDIDFKALPSKIPENL